MRPVYQCETSDGAAGDSESKPTGPSPRPAVCNADETGRPLSNGPASPRPAPLLSKASRLQCKRLALERGRSISIHCLPQPRRWLRRDKQGAWGSYFQSQYLIAQDITSGCHGHMVPRGILSAVKQATLPLLVSALYAGALVNAVDLTPTGEKSSFQTDCHRCEPFLICIVMALLQSQTPVA